MSARHLYMAIHFPRPEHVDDLLAAMAALGSAMQTVSGLLDVSVWRDRERIVALSVWETAAALDDAAPAITRAIADVPFERWESRPRELFRLDELEMPAG